MKIGEAGEAFFVLETDEDVPEDLLTSPLLEATKVRSAFFHSIFILILIHPYIVIMIDIFPFHPFAPSFIVPFILPQSK